jgi:hypothetical protein
MLMYYSTHGAAELKSARSGDIRVTSPVRKIAPKLWHGVQRLLGHHNVPY